MCDNSTRVVVEKAQGKAECMHYRILQRRHPMAVYTKGVAAIEAVEAAACSYIILYSDLHELAHHK